MNFKKFVLKIVRFYFHGIIKLEDFDLDNVLMDGKSYEDILIYDISYQTLNDSKPLQFCNWKPIRFEKIDGFMRIYDKTRHLTLFGSEEYEAIYNRIRYLISQKSGITYIFSHYFAKVDSYDHLPVEKILTLHDVIIHIKSVLNKDKNHYY